MYFHIHYLRVLGTLSFPFLFLNLPLGLRFSDLSTDDHLFQSLRQNRKCLCFVAFFRRDTKLRKRRFMNNAIPFGNGILFAASSNAWFSSPFRPLRLRGPTIRSRGEDLGGAGNVICYAVR